MFKKGQKVYTIFNNCVEVIKYNVEYGTYTVKLENDYQLRYHEFDLFRNPQDKIYYSVIKKNKENIFLKQFEFRKFNSKLKDFINLFFLNQMNITSFYQSDIDWTLEQQTKYIENLFLDKATVKLTLIVNDDKTFKETGYKYEIIDGKQRILAIAKFFKNELPIFGNVYYKNLLEEDVQFFNNISAGYKSVIKNHEYYRKITDEEKIKLFLLENDFGSLVDKKHLNSLKEKNLTIIN